MISNTILKNINSIIKENEEGGAVIGGSAHKSKDQILKRIKTKKKSVYRIIRMSDNNKNKKVRF